MRQHRHPLAWASAAIRWQAVKPPGQVTSGWAMSIAPARKSSRKLARSVWVS